MREKSEIEDKIDQANSSIRYGHGLLILCFIVALILIVMALNS
jgi:hypothetical protein